MFLMKDNQITLAQVKVSGSKSYTLAELNVAAEQFVENDASSDLNAPDAIKLRIFLGMFLQWLARKDNK